MLKYVIIGVTAALLGGCGASSINSSGLSAEDGPEKTSVKKEVTGSIVQTSATADAGLQEAAPSRTAATSQAATVTPDANALQAEASALAAVSTPGSATYKIGPQDVLDVSVFKVAELSQSTQVSDAGTITFPLVGEIVADGKTPREVEKELTTLLRQKYLQRPQVTVFVKEFNSQRVTLEGAVKKPGVFPIRGSLSLLQAVAMAQGFEDLSDDTVLVFRSAGGKRAAARFDVSEIRTGTIPDPQLQAGDVVVAGSSTLKKGFNTIMKFVPLANVFAYL